MTNILINIDKSLFKKLLQCRQENLKLNELKQLYLKKFFG